MARKLKWHEEENGHFWNNTRLKQYWIFHKIMLNSLPSRQSEIIETISFKRSNEHWFWTFFKKNTSLDKFLYESVNSRTTLQKTAWKIALFIFFTELKRHNARQITRNVFGVFKKVNNNVILYTVNGKIMKQPY